jgi:hypothetical protein
MWKDRDFENASASYMTSDEARQCPKRPPNGIWDETGTTLDVVIQVAAIHSLCSAPGGPFLFPSQAPRNDAYPDCRWYAYKNSADEDQVENW